MNPIPSVVSSAGFSLPVLGQGTWCFGGRESRDPGNDDDRQIAALQNGIRAGLTLIDTAEYYAAGYAEQLVGQAIAPFPREKLFLTSKVWKTHLHRDDVLRAAEDSLRRLNTDYLDLYLYHQVSDEVPLEETIGAMDLLVERCLVRHIGVSNFAPARLRRAMDCARHPIVVDQVQYSLKIREPEKELLDFCRTSGVLLQAWRPVRGVESCPLTEELCRKYRLSLPQLALAWIAGIPGTAALCAATQERHLAENVAAVQTILAEEDRRLLDREYPGITYTSKVPLS